jgi:DNA segregation ATPase FtsK/SpoIIIE, S-DNA-T family
VSSVSLRLHSATLHPTLPFHSSLPKGEPSLSRSTSPKAGEDRLSKDLLAIAFLTLGAFLLAALIFSARDQGGILTHWLARGFTLILGVGAFGVPAVAFALAAFYGLEKPPVTPVRALIGVVLMFVAVLTIVHMQATPPDPEIAAKTFNSRWAYLFTEDNLLSRGGYLGAAMALVFLTVVGPLGSYIILSGVACCALILITQGTTPIVLAWVRQVAGDGVRAASGSISSIQARRRDSAGPRAPRGDGKPKAKREKAEKPEREPKRKRAKAGPIVDLGDDELPERVPEAEEEPEQYTELPSEETAPEPKAADLDEVPEALHSGAKQADDEDMAGRPTMPPAAATSGPLIAKTGGNNPLRMKPKQAMLLDPDALFQLPPCSLLTEYPEEEETKEDRAVAAENIIKLIDTLESFGINAKVTHYERGPVLTRYEVEPERGIRVNQLTRHTDDLRMALAAWDIRVEAPIPGKSAVGIEVPNKKKMTVGLRSLMECEEFRNHPSSLAVALGRDIAGHPVIADLVQMPHLLIAGATNSGKSVCLHSIVVSLLMRTRPQEVQLIMIDPKRVEMNLYDGVPHLMSPICSRAQEAADVLRKAITEMSKRLDQFAKVSAANIAEYNFFTAGAQLAAGKKEISVETLQKRLKLDEIKARRLMDMMEWGGVVIENPDDPDVWRVAIAEDDMRTVPLPRVVIIIDELADLMMQARAEFEFSICRIAQLARATGIHLVIATQRPSVKVVTGNIKANIPSRIALSVASQVDSRTILDGIGAERLIGRGDMLYAPIDASKPRRAQGAFVSRGEIEAIVEHLRKQGEPNYSIIPQVPDEDDGTGGNSEVETTDELYADAVRYVVSEDEASVSMIQRRFKVGYARAGRLIDMMAQRGVVGPSMGSKPRQVLIGSSFVDGALGGTTPDLAPRETPASAFDGMEPKLDDTDEMEHAEAAEG